MLDWRRLPLVGWLLDRLGRMKLAGAVVPMALDVVFLGRGRNFRGVAAQLADSLEHDLGAPSYPLTSPSIPICRPASLRISPTRFRSPGKTNTVKGQTRKSSQKSTKCTPPLPRCTRMTFPVMHRVAPMWSRASEKGTHCPKLTAPQNDHEDDGREKG
jgi:hypothetical protein